MRITLAYVAALAALWMAGNALGAQSRAAWLWWKTQGGWVYCHEPQGAGFTLLCFSTSTGRWISVHEKPRESSSHVTTGTDRKYIGFHRSGTEVARRWADSRIGDSWAICASTRTFMKCHVGTVKFWIKHDGTYRLVARYECGLFKESPEGKEHVCRRVPIFRIAPGWCDQASQTRTAPSSCASTASRGSSPNDQRAHIGPSQRGWVKTKNPAYWRRDQEIESLRRSVARRVPMVGASK